ncbi:hypothetical protein QYF61_002355 [Mycteria americana]|uniref:Uncharacterized protein n=1 Tax=Mycteria americana TaxID=33587 RepID=A0AAN7NND0_MYCAM|nr:hypothetical protein QYF61_002355 [Mycteria americana]
MILKVFSNLYDSVILLKGEQAVTPHPAGSWAALGLILFNITVSNLGDGTKLTLCEFMGDSNLGEVLSTLEGRAAILKNLNNLEKWTDRNIVKFNKSKLSPVHLGWHDPVHPNRSGCTQTGRALTGWEEAFQKRTQWTKS